MSNQKPKNEFSFWTTDNEKDFFPSVFSIKKIPAGLYRVNFFSDSGYFLSKETTPEVKKIDFSVFNHNEIYNDIELFLKNKNKYKELDLPFNYNILLYGFEEYGKNTIKSNLLNNIIKKNICIPIVLEEPNDIQFLDTITSIEDDKAVLLIIEDIDTMIQKHGSVSVCSMLSELYKKENILILVSSEDIDQLRNSISNNLFMFNKLIKIDFLEEKDRKLFFEKRLNKNIIKDKKIILSKLVKDTDSTPISLLNKFISYITIHDKSYEKALEYVKELNYKEENSKNIGF